MPSPQHPSSYSRPRSYTEVGTINRLIQGRPRRSAPCPIVKWHILSTSPVGDMISRGQWFVSVRLQIQSSASLPTRIYRVYSVGGRLGRDISRSEYEFCTGISRVTFCRLLVGRLCTNCFADCFRERATYPARADVYGGTREGAQSGSCT